MLVLLQKCVSKLSGIVAGSCPLIHASWFLLIITPSTKFFAIYMHFLFMHSFGDTCWNICYSNINPRPILLMLSRHAWGDNFTLKTPNLVGSCLLNASAQFITWGTTAFHIVCVIGFLNNLGKAQFLDWRDLQRCSKELKILTNTCSCMKWNAVSFILNEAGSIKKMLWNIKVFLTIIVCAGNL